jgi:carotenoid 1,2-hydratase
MLPPDHAKSKPRFTFSSSVAADVWHRKTDPKAYEWWYFDALSDDGNEAVVIMFLDNYVFSSKYNRKPRPAAPAHDTRTPAVSFLYSRNGKPVYRTVAAFDASAFSADSAMPACMIGNSSFRWQSAPYGTGYVVSVNIPLGRNRRLEAFFEWLSIDADLSAGNSDFDAASHFWNMVAPRSDVSGRITLFDARDQAVETHHFRGTGYHDHNIDNRWLRETVRDWHWGRAHFSDVTAVFYRYRELKSDAAETKFLIVRDGEMSDRNVAYDEQNYSMNRYGIRYPTRLRLVSDENARLRVKPIKLIDSSFYYIRSLAEMTLTLRDGRPRKTVGITEFLAPENLKHRWMDWLGNLGSRRDTAERRR